MNAWLEFKTGKWSTEGIDVRDFIQKIIHPMREILVF